MQVINISVKFKVNSSSKCNMLSSTTQDNRKVEGIDEVENKIIENVNKKLLLNSSTVAIQDNLSKESQEFCMIKNIDGEIELFNKNGQLVGKAQHWYNDEIPNHLKSKDGIIKDPYSGDDLLEWIIDNEKLSVLPKNVYREYIYLKNHEKLQQTYEVDYYY